MCACVRCNILPGVPSPVKHPEKVDMVIFRENTEDIYAGIEYAGGTPEAQKMMDFLATEFPEGFREDPFWHQGRHAEFWKWQSADQSVRIDVQVGIGIKPVSYVGTSG